jgi:hypothetical protein
MLRLTKAFLDIALWRETPAHLPASLLLLVLVACAAALMEVLGVFLLPGPHDAILLRIAVEVGLPLAFTWAVLALGRRRARFLQTATALLGVGILAEIIVYPLYAMLRVMGQDRAAMIPFWLLLYVGVVLWYLVACAHVWRAALDAGLLLGGAISVSSFVLSTVIEQQMLPPT